jgi:hypothetical protein
MLLAPDHPQMSELLSGRDARRPASLPRVSLVEKELTERND